MSGANFRKKIYTFCYIKECEMAMLKAYVVQLPDPSFESLQLDDKEINGSYLEHASIALPLVKVCRRIASEKLCEIIPPKERLLELEEAWAEIPVNIKLHAQMPLSLQNYSRLYTICKYLVDLVFHYSRLKLLKPRVILHVQDPKVMDGYWIQDAINSALFLTQIAKLSFSRQEFDSVDLLLAPALQLAGLCQCALQTPALDQILMLHLNALEHLSKLAPDKKRRVKPHLGTMEKKLAIRLLSQPWI